MKVSVITVVFNDLEGLKKTIDSVIGQTYKAFEYIIWDGGSTDGTAEYLKTLPSDITTKSEPDTGIYNAMNKAVKMAKGDYCLFMNAGDSFYDSNVLSKAAEIIGDADLYVGNTIEVGEESKEMPAPEPLTVGYLINKYIYHQSTFIRTDLLREHPYNEKLKIVSDWEFFFERWLTGCSYQKLDFIVSKFYLGGISSTHYDELVTERQQVIDRLVPPRIREYYEPKNLLEEKIKKALGMPPVTRDLKIIRNAFKALLRDLF